MKNAPIIAALDLWSLGHSASQIAEMLGFPNHRQVSLIVERARSIGDKRAVLHAAANKRLIGRPGRMIVPPVANVVPALGKPICAHGHPRTPENVTDLHRCRECHRIRGRAAYERARRTRAAL